MATTLEIKVDGDVRGTIEADFAQASSPILLDGDSTPFHVADARHCYERAAKLVIDWCRSQGGEIIAEDEYYVVESVDTDLRAMVATLKGHGERFCGNNPEDEAQDWIDHGFDAVAADGWCEIGVWDAGIAAQLKDAGLSPDQVTRGAESLVEAAEDAAEEYTDGDPIYSVCNSDTSIKVLIRAAVNAR